MGRWGQRNSGSWSGLEHHPGPDSEDRLQEQAPSFPDASAPLGVKESSGKHSLFPSSPLPPCSLPRTHHGAIFSSQWQAERSGQAGPQGATGPEGIKYLAASVDKKWVLGNWKFPCHFRVNCVLDAAEGCWASTLRRALAGRGLCPAAGSLLLWGQRDPGWE